MADREQPGSSFKGRASFGEAFEGLFRLEEELGEEEFERRLTALEERLAARAQRWASPTSGEDAAMGEGQSRLERDTLPQGFWSPVLAARFVAMIVLCRRARSSVLGVDDGTPEVLVALADAHYRPTGRELACEILEGPEITPQGEFRLALYSQDPSVSGKPAQCELMPGEDEGLRAVASFVEEGERRFVVRFHIRNLPVEAVAAAGETRTWSPERIQTIAEKLLHEDPGERAAAIRALGEARAQKALGLLEEAAFDDHEEVRRAAREAIRLIGEVAPVTEPIPIPWEAIRVRVCA